ncbi:MAG: hypothetical protein ACUVQG_01120 [Thermogutta sp.]
MAKLFSRPSLVLVVTVWYTLTGVLGVALHHHLGWHSPGDFASLGGCISGSACAVSNLADRTGRPIMSSHTSSGLAGVFGIGSLSSYLRPTVGGSCHNCPICQFQFQPRAPQPVLTWIKPARFRRFTPFNSIQRVVFTPDFAWQSRAPPTV